MKENIFSSSGAICCVEELQVTCGFELYLKYAQNGILERDCDKKGEKSRNLVNSDSSYAVANEPCRGGGVLLLLNHHYSSGIFTPSYHRMHCSSYFSTINHLLHLCFSTVRCSLSSVCSRLLKKFDFIT